MSHSNWRRLLVGLWLFAVVELTTAIVAQVFYFAALPGVDNDFTFFPAKQRLDLEPIGPNLYRLTVGPDSVAYREGARTGDVLNTSLLAPGLRFRVFSGFWWPAESVTLPLHDAGGTKKAVVLTAVRSPGTIDMWIANAGLVWMLLFAGIIAFRRSDVPQARALSLLLILFNIGLSFQVQNWATPLPVLDAGLSALNGFPFYASAALFATYAGLFARPLSPIRKALTNVTYGFAVALAIADAIFWMQSLSVGVSPGVWKAFTQIQDLAFGVPLLPVIAALRSARGAEREQLVWASASLMPFYVCYLVAGLSTDPTFARIASYAVNVSFVLAPLGLTYSVLNRRLLDVGFAVNRVAVFTAVSAILVGVFILVEWVLSQILGAGRTANVVVAGCLALVLGLSMRYVHIRVDHVLDRLFFKKRHDDEHAIRAFAHEAAYISDGGLVLTRADAVLQRHADASYTEFVLNDECGRFGDIDENDPAIVSLRAWHKRVDLSDCETAIHGEFAYPMVARGRLNGVLVLGPKRSGESYAPDESEAIEELAHGVGLALDSLRSTSSNGALMDELLEVKQLLLRVLDASISTASR